ncbi:Uncharacterised protein [Burkholderia pseudomallei]|nr:Uncharacterised protein [Burkholderia pseudomallei]
MFASFLNVASSFVPPRSSMTFSMFMNFSSFACASSAPNIASFANFIFASVGITICAWCSSAKIDSASRISVMLSDVLTPIIFIERTYFSASFVAWSPRPSAVMRARSFCIFFVSSSASRRSPSACAPVERAA